MSKNYVDYMVEETKNILAIDSPSGYTKAVSYTHLTLPTT